jgi:CheY-like chemotaxis protein
VQADEHARLRALSSARKVAAFVALPFLTAVALHRSVTGRPFGILMVEIGAIATLAAGLWWDRERRPDRGALLLVVLLYGIDVCALLQFGPLMGTGAMFLTWALFVVFFFERLWLATIGVFCSPLIVGSLVETNRIEVAWPRLQDGLAGWVRVSGTVALLTFLGGFLFRELLASQRRALAHEVEARAREAEAHARADRARAVLAATARLEALGHLAGGAAHEFNNRLTTVLGNVELLRTAAEEERQELFAEIEVAMAGARSLTTQLLALTPHGTHPAGDAAPLEVLRALEESLRLLHVAGVVFRSFDVSVDLPTVAMGAGALHRGLLELVLGARDAMNRERSETQLEVSAKSTPEGRVAFELRGPARPPEGLTPQLESMLASVDGILMAANGTWSLAIPVATRQTELARETLPRPRTVLVVEDDRAIGSIMKRVLARSGFEVSVSETVADALQRVEGSPFDLLIADARLPDGDSSAVIRRFREQNEQATILVCSGYIDGDGLFEEVRRFDVGFLQKPFGPSELLRVIESLTIR